MHFKAVNDDDFRFSEFLLFKTALVVLLKN